MTHVRLVSAAVFAVSLSLVAACGDDEGGGGDGPTPSYRFDSRFDPGTSSVDHRGQTTRHVLLRDLIGEMRRISAGVLDGSIAPETVDEPGEVVTRLDAIYAGGSTTLGSRPLPPLVAGGDTTCQATYDDLGGAKLLDKVAGEDDVTDFRDWDGDDEGSSGPAFRGTLPADALVVPEGGTVATPVGLVAALFATFEAQVRACALDSGACPTGPGGEELPLTVTPEGLDLAQLVEKFLIGAIAWSQSSDDYLDDDVQGKGLLADHTERRGDGAPDTTLEHAWDEGFGYFGAAADYGAYTDDEIRGAGGRPGWSNGYHDADGDGCIDVFTEINFFASTNAAKRDAGSATGTDLTGDAFEALVAGRTLLAQTPRALEPAELDRLRAHRDAAEGAWERALAATAVHYVNATLADLEACGTGAYDFEDHAKHWGELKGFAVGLQFSPRSPFAGGTAAFDQLQARLGATPVLCAGDVAQGRADLLAARDALRDGYGFAQADVEAW